MTTAKLGPIAWCGLIIVNVFLWAPLVVIAMLAFSDANSMTFPPPAYSMRWLVELTTDRLWTSSMETSVYIGLVSVFLSVLLGVPLGLALSKGEIGKSSTVQAFVAVPLILPAISLAIGLYFVSAKVGILDGMLPLIIAHTSVGVSYVVVTVGAADRGVDRSLEAAARTLGATFFQAIWTITLPLIVVGIVGGALLAFLHSWDDVVNALMLGTARVQPFPLKLWSEMQHVLNPIAATAAVLLSVVSIAALGLVALFMFSRRARMPKEQMANVILRNKG